MLGFFICFGKNGEDEADYFGLGCAAVVVEAKREYLGCC